MEIDEYAGEVFVLDRGSHLGTIVDGKKLDCIALPLKLTRRVGTNRQTT
jgi:hypothetical protein